MLLLSQSCMSQLAHADALSKKHLINAPHTDVPMQEITQLEHGVLDVCM